MITGYRTATISISTDSQRFDADRAAFLGTTFSYQGRHGRNRNYRKENAVRKKHRNHPEDLRVLLCLCQKEHRVRPQHNKPQDREHCRKKQRLQPGIQKEKGIRR